MLEKVSSGRSCLRVCADTARHVPCHMQRQPSSTQAIHEARVRAGVTSGRHKRYAVVVLHGEEGLVVRLTYGRLMNRRRTGAAANHTRRDRDGEQAARQERKECVVAARKGEWSGRRESSKVVVAVVVGGCDGTLTSGSVEMEHCWWAWEGGREGGGRREGAFGSARLLGVLGDYAN